MVKIGVKKKKFREGQSEQVLDTLFFDFIELAKRLQPKVVIAENVKGLLQGDARQYLKQVYDELTEAGYYVQHFLLDASKMGVPQKRERVFIIGLRNDLAELFLYQADMFTLLPKLELNFKEDEIPFKDIFNDYCDRPLSKHYKKFWDIRKYGDIDFSISSARMGKNPNAQFQYKYLYMHKVSNTITAGEQCVLYDYPRYRNYDELCEGGSYPKDYKFLNNKPEYLIGMSVPPVMTAQISHEIYKQWISKL